MSRVFHRSVKQAGVFFGVETFTVDNDSKHTKHKVALVNNKEHQIVERGTCKCGGRILELCKSPINWQVCGKCSKDCSEQEKPRKLVGWPGLLP